MEKGEKWNQLESKKEDEKEEGDEDLGVLRGLPPADANWWESGERRGEKWWEVEGRRGEEMGREKEEEEGGEDEERGRRGGGEERRRGENL